MFVTNIEVSKYSITKTTQVWQLYPSKQQKLNMKLQWGPIF